MDGSSVTGLMMMGALVFALIGFISTMRVSSMLKVILCTALVLRVVGALLRHFVLMDFYGGVGDAQGYYGSGLRNAEQLADFDFGMLTDPTQWDRGRWWGTNFTKFVSGIVLLLIGPTMRGGFIAFSLLSFFGLLCFAASVVRKRSGWGQVGLYLLLLGLWPSLFFWPASMGKDALILLGLGIAVAGHCRVGGRAWWLLLLLGGGLVFSIRPALAGIIGVAVVSSHWLGVRYERNTVAVLRAIVLTVIGLVVVWYGLGFEGANVFDVDNIQEYAAQEAQHNQRGGSAIETVGGFSPVGALLSFVNVWFRPFVWEAHNIMALFSALEIVALWGIVWWRRDLVWHNLRNWRQSRFLRFGIPFVLLYTVSLGAAVANLGIIARQRIFLFPILFALVAVPLVPGYRTRKATRGRKREAKTSPVLTG